MAEVPDAELAILRNSYALLRKMETDPRSKPSLEAAVKVHHPEVRTEADVAAEATAPILEPIKASLEKINARFEAEDAKAVERQQTADEANLSTAFANLRSQGLTEAGEAKVKELMVSRNIADPEAAFALFERNNPKPAADAPSWQPDGWDFSTTTPSQGATRDLEGLYANEDKWADQEAALTLNEIRVGQKAA